jgi:hypothetical protein
MKRDDEKVIQSGPKVFDQFYNSIKNYKLPGKM